MQYDSQKLSGLLKFVWMSSGSKGENLWSKQKQFSGGLKRASWRG